MRGETQTEESSVVQLAQKEIAPELCDLLWLCIHQMDLIRSTLQEVHPDFISKNQDILYLFALFLQGHTIHEILASMEERDMLRRLLMELMMKGDLYEQSQAQKATKQILDKLILSALEEKFRTTQKSLSEMDAEHDLHKYLSLLQEFQDLRTQIEAQRNKIAPNREHSSTEEKSSHLEDPTD